MRGLGLELLDSPEWQNQLQDLTRNYVNEKGPICSSDLKLDGHLRWSGGYNGTANVTRIVLDYLYSTGEMIIHHKKGTRKYYVYISDENRHQVGSKPPRLGSIPPPSRLNPAT